METFSAWLALCAEKSPVSGEFPAQRPVTWSFDVFFDLYLNKHLSKQSWGWWFQMLSCPLWRHCNDYLHREFHWLPMFLAHFFRPHDHWHLTKSSVCGTLGVNSSPPEQNVCHFADDIYSDAFSWMKHFVFWITISLKCVLKVPVDSNPTLV